MTVEVETATGADDQPAPMFEFIELLFFAYREFVGDADAVLGNYGFGRAHHRILYFVDRRPGLSIAELLDILQVTKQSLNRVLKELVTGGLVEVRPGVADRRQRRLFATSPGTELVLRLACLQSRRLARALAELPPGSRKLAGTFLAAMIDPRTGAGSVVTQGRSAHPPRLEAVR